MSSYQVISFDGSTTIQEFLQSINKCLAVQDCTHSGFALYSDDPLDPDLETCLQNHIKVYIYQNMSFWNYLFSVFFLYCFTYFSHEYNSVLLNLPGASMVEWLTLNLLLLTAVLLDLNPVMDFSLTIFILARM